MGLYSNNRISNLDPDYQYTEPVREEAEPEVEDQNDDTISFDGIDADVEGSLDENYDGLMNSLLQIGENDNDVFNSMITTDFIITCENATLGKSDADTYNRERLDTLKENINKVINFAETAIKSEANSVIAKTDKLNNKDKSIAKKFSTVLSKENIKEFTGIPQFSFPSLSSSIMESVDSLASNEEIKGSVIEAVADISESSNIEDVELKMSTLGEVFDRINENVNHSVSLALVKEDNFIPDEQQLDIIKSYTESQFVKIAMENSAYNMIYNLKLVKESINEVLDSLTESEFDVYKANRLYNVASTAAKVSLKQFNSFKNAIVRENAALRKATIIIGKFALESAKGKTPDISELDMYNVCENSDTYVFDFYTEKEDPLTDKCDTGLRKGELKYDSKDTEGVEQEVIDAAQD